jgi:nitroreductase
MDVIDALLSRVSPSKFCDPAPTAEQLDRILAAAKSAPDHGRLQPWRFVIIEGPARAKLGEILARSLQRREPEASETMLDAERAKAMRAPTIVVVAASIVDHPRIPEIEQIAAVAAASQNVLLAAHGMGLGAVWKTGDAAYDPIARDELGLGRTDRIVAFLYVGTVAVAGKARPPARLDVVSRLPQ